MKESEKLEQLKRDIAETESKIANCKHDFDTPIYDAETATAVDGYTSEGYRIIDGVAYDEFYDPIYSVDTF